MDLARFDFCFRARGCLLAEFVHDLGPAAAVDNPGFVGTHLLSFPSSGFKAINLSLKARFFAPLLIVDAVRKGFAEAGCFPLGSGGIVN